MFPLPELTHLSSRTEREMGFDPRVLYSRFVRCSDIL